MKITHFMGFIYYFYPITAKHVNETETKKARHMFRVRRVCKDREQSAWEYGSVPGLCRDRHSMFRYKGKDILPVYTPHNVRTPKKKDIKKRAKFDCKVLKKIMIRSL